MQISSSKDDVDELQLRPQRLTGIGEGRGKKKLLSFVWIDIISPPFFFKNKVIVYSTNITFDFMTIYLKGVTSYIGENAHCRKSTRLKFVKEIDLEVIQKRYAAILF